MKKLFSFNLMLCLILCCNTLAASELSGALSAPLTGKWKHDKQPVWVQITNQDNVISGTFMRHDIKPELNGKPFIKQFVAEADNQLLWNGLVYAARLKEFKEAEISQDSVDAFVLTATVKVAFIKRTVVSNWSRSKGVSSEQ
ncbi:MAG: hypothetical protein P8I38_13225 [Arenicella sp.]|jgi:hypothetical protein|nr:hypothetical protein [Arenicella sp.]